MLALELIYFFFVLVMLGQAVFSVYLTIYAWEVPERIEQAESPKKFEKPRLSFSILLPAREEQAVIGETIRSIAAANYPSVLLQIMVVCEQSDLETIAAAESSIVRHQIKNAKVISFSDGPINKPHGLNVALGYATKDSTVIFDAEDSVHPDIFNIANTLFLNTEADVIQAGVQLMNYDSRWFSSHNVLEYYFWFRSRMHFHARVKMVPLGGNTVFFLTNQLRQVGGWDENCLTEDAEIGVRLSARGAIVVATYDAEHVTKEETPATVAQFIKQRTRWNQGFIQVLRKGEWKKYKGFWRKTFCVYTFAFPFAQSLFFALAPFALILGLTTKFSVLLSLFGFVPILIVFLQLTINLVGMHEFISEQHLKRKLRIYLLMIITFIPYQILLSIGAVRAAYRDLRGQANWEKTDHEGQHRPAERAPTLEQVT